MIDNRDRAGPGPRPDFFCTQAQAFFDLPGFFLDYRPRIRPRSIN